VFPNIETAKPWAQQRGFNAEHLSDIAKLPEFNKQVLDEITAKAKEAQLSGLERIRKVHIIDYPMTVNNDLMTPTFKIKRNVAQRVFKDEIAEMYRTPLDA